MINCVKDLELTSGFSNVKVMVNLAGSSVLVMVWEDKSQDGVGWRENEERQIKDNSLQEFATKKRKEMRQSLVGKGGQEFVFFYG